MRLEQLESQSALMELISDSVAGMANTRKALQSLGKTPDVSAVQHILDKAPHVCTPPHFCTDPRNDLWMQARPYVQGYKKHLRVATSLNLVCKLYVSCARVLL